ncbi:MAG: glycoside hydrolase family 97 protein [Thalassotalea sp.]|nr:glycoside hydrolase family 97 protein [Thalassotalea sp.]
MKYTTNTLKLLCIGVISTLFMQPLAFAKQQVINLKSPDGTITVDLLVDDNVQYQVMVDGKSLISPSTINLFVESAKSLAEQPEILKVKRSSVDETLKPEVKVKSATIQNTYNQLAVTFDNNNTVEFRAFNNGVAYRYNTNFKGDIKIKNEVAEFNFSSVANVYYPEEDGFYSHNERAYIFQSITNIDDKKLASTPTLVDNGGVKVLITETGLEDYPGIWLLGNNKKGLQGTFAQYPLDKAAAAPWVDRNEPILKRADFLAKTKGKRTFPWRVMAIARNDAELITNQLTYQLAEPNRLKDISWIKPGKVAWDWYNANNLFGVDFKAGVNTQTYKYYIDFASDYGLEYVILDEGWYPLGDLLGTVPEMDVPEIMAYAKKKNVGIILWASWLTLRDQFDDAMNLFAELGAVGIKPDFFQRDDQEMVNFYWQIAEEAANRKMLVDFHGAYKPAGLRRTYPNVITREGVKGLENNKWDDVMTAEHNTTIPFIRMVAGPMDYTPGAMSNSVGIEGFKQLEYTAKADDHRDFTIRFNRPMSQTTRVHQMALFTVYESPLQMMADTPTVYRKEEECARFISKIPSVWDETKVLHGKIGDYISIARKNGNTWFVGTLNDENPRDLPLNLDFLTADQNYEIEIFQDGLNADRWAEDYKKITTTVKKGDKLTMVLFSAGGYTARITPVK